MIGLQVVNCGDLARPIYSDSSQHPPIFENKDAPFLSGYMEASQMGGESRGWRFLPIPPGVAQMVKKLLSMQETQVQSLGQKDSLE